MSNGRTVLIVQSRMGSTRLPGKSMLPLAGDPLIARLLERLLPVTIVHDLVLAIPDKSGDDPLACLGERLGVAVFRGSEDDVVDRYYQAAKAHRATTVVRIPGDNPVPEPGEVERIIRYHQASGNDFSSNYPDVFDNGYPDGIGAEVFSLEALERIWQSATDPRNREHPHTNFYEHPETFRIGTIQCPSEFRRPDIVLDVNTREEYEYMAELYAALYPQNPRFGIRDVIRWHDDVYAAKTRR